MGILGLGLLCARGFGGGGTAAGCGDPRFCARCQKSRIPLYPNLLNNQSFHSLCLVGWLRFDEYTTILASWPLATAILLSQS